MEPSQNWQSPSEGSVDGVSPHRQTHRDVCWSRSKCLQGTDSRGEQDRHDPRYHGACVTSALEKR